MGQAGMSSYYGPAAAYGSLSAASMAVAAAAQQSAMSAGLGAPGQVSFSFSILNILLLYTTYIHIHTFDSFYWTGLKREKRKQPSPKNPLTIYFHLFLDISLSFFFFLNSPFPLSFKWVSVPEYPKTQHLDTILAHSFLYRKLFVEIYILSFSFSHTLCLLEFTKSNTES